MVVEEDEEDDIGPTMTLLDTNHILCDVKWSEQITLIAEYEYFAQILLDFMMRK